MLSFSWKQLLVALVLILNCNIPSEPDFLEYYRHANVGIIQFSSGKTAEAKASLERALRAFPEQNHRPVDYWLIAELVNIYETSEEEKVRHLLTNYNIANSDEEAFRLRIIRHEELVDKYAQFIDSTHYYHKNHEEITLKIDTLLAIDQGTRGNIKDKDLKLYPNIELINDFELGNSYVQKKLKILYKDYGLLGSYSCFSCSKLTVMLHHIDDYQAFLKLEPTLMQLVRKGHLPPNLYANIYDRNYSLNDKHSLNYYYFNIYKNKINENVRIVDDLSPKEIAEVNKRRKKIALPPIPLEFYNFKIRK